MRVWARGGRRRPFSEFTYIHIAIPPLAHVCSPPQPWDPEWGTGPLRSQVSLHPWGGGGSHHLQVSLSIAGASC